MTLRLGQSVIDGVLAGYSDAWTVRVEIGYDEDGDAVPCYVFVMDGPAAPKVWGAPTFRPPADIVPVCVIETVADFAEACRIITSEPVESEITD
mgnify:CR=1 FL=1